MKKICIFTLIVILFIGSSISLAFESGYDIYDAIQRSENPQSLEDASMGVAVNGYFRGYVDSVNIIQTMLFQMMFPKGGFSEAERKVMAKQINFHYLNLPKDGSVLGQIILIYKKFAEKHPEKLNNSARICVYISLVEAFGWRSPID